MHLGVITTTVFNLHYLHSSEVFAKFSIRLSISTDNGGGKVNVLIPGIPLFERGETIPNLSLEKKVEKTPLSLLQDSFPSKIDLSAVLTELRAFEGVWQYCHPGLDAYVLSDTTFNARGDVLFGLKSFYDYKSSSRILYTHGADESQPADLDDVSGMYRQDSMGRSLLTVINVMSKC